MYWRYRRWARDWFAEVCVGRVILRWDRSHDYVSGKALEVTLHWWPLWFIQASTRRPRLTWGSLRPLKEE